jgi:hypothetical protein
MACYNWMTAMRAAPINIGADIIVGWRDDAARRRDIGRGIYHNR